MSRTFRVRHSATKLSKKWANGSFTVARSKRLNDIFCLIAHGIYNLPCKVEGKPNAYAAWEIPNRTWYIDIRTHKECLSEVFTDAQFKAIETSYTNSPVYEVMPLSKHPWARSNCRCCHRKGWRRLIQRSKRRRDHMSDGEKNKFGGYEDFDVHPNRYYKVP